MEQKYNESTINRPEGDRVVDAPLVLIDIPSFIKQIKSEKAWDENDRNSITVFKSDKLRIVLVAMHKNAVMHTDHPKNIISIQIIQGKIKLYTDEKTAVIEEDQIFVLHENISYKIEAAKKAVFLLTVIE
jgi:quercetin dioxygenase-like cupin family protein